MPALKTARHEKIALALVEGHTLRDAYWMTAKKGEARCSERTARREAAKIANLPEVKARIEELQEAQAKRVDIGVDTLLKELNEMLALAKRTRQPGAGVGAVVAKARLLGLITDKQEIEATVRKPARRPTDEKRLTVEEWQKQFTAKAPLQ